MAMATTADAARRSARVPVIVQRLALALLLLALWWLVSLTAPPYVLPVAVRCRSVVTIHDCIHLMFPQYLPNRAAYAYARASMWVSAKRSDRILTVSEASKRDILHFFNVPPDKISVVYNAIDERFWIEPDPEDVARVEKILKRL